MRRLIFALIRTLRERGTPVASCFYLLCIVANMADAATVTKKIFVNFNGTLSNSGAYTLGAGELDVTNSFAANGSASVSNGVADIPGNIDATSGFYSRTAGLGNLNTQNWVAEAVFSPDVPTASQPGAFNNFLDVEGDTYFRYNGNGKPKASEFGYFNGTIDSAATTVASLTANQFNHVALTWTAATNTLEGFINGVSQGTVSSASTFNFASNRLGFGFFARDGFIGRAVDGKLDSVAFSTFTGSFSAGTDFQLTAPLPPLVATINRDTAGSLGSITITNNSGAPFPIAGYSVTSANGALDRTNWQTVTAHRDAPGGNGGGDGSVDPDNDWVILSAANAEKDLSEYQVSFPAGNGGSLGVGASLNLGNVWRKVPGSLEDVVVAVADPGGNSMFVPVTYAGNGGQSFRIGDLDFDGDVDISDWQLFRTALQSNLSGLTVAKAYRTGSDLNADGLSNLVDFDAFVTSYNSVNGSGSFEKMIAGVPEPSSISLLAVLAACLGVFTSSIATMNRLPKQLKNLGRLKRPASFVLYCVIAGVVAQAATAATVTRRVYVNFVGTLSGGNTYTLGPGELDTTGTFAKNGSATIANGVADIPGDVDASSGFLFNAVTLPTLTTTNWVTEAVMAPDVPAAQQPPGTANNNFNHFLDVQGDLFYRYNGNTVGQPKIAQFGYWDGATEPTLTTPEAPTNKFSHVALTWNAGTKTLEGFIDGVSQGTVSTGNVYATPSTNIGYGFFARTGFLNRAINGKLDSVAFSTFTGTFQPGFGAQGDFQLDPSTAPSLVLKLKVNTVSGRATIVNNTSSAISFQGYEIASALSSLDVTNWVSLADQNIDAIGGGQGQTWQEGGHPSAGDLEEVFLLGGTTLAPGQSLWLGNAYNKTIGAHDLAFSYRRTGVSGDVNGLITYDSTPPTGIDGDFNGNGVVDAADYTVWRDKLGTSAILANDPTPGSVTQSDYLVWKVNFGKVFGAGAQSNSASAIPEPASQALLVIAGGILLTIAAIQRRKVAPNGYADSAQLSRLERLRSGAGRDAAKLARRTIRFAVAASMVVLGLAPARASVTLDRVYKLGDDDNNSGTPAAGLLVGSTTSTGNTFDSQGTAGTNTFIDLTPSGGPVYADVTGRPQLVGAGLGVSFDGVNDYLTGYRLGLPSTSVSATGSTQKDPLNPSSVIVGTLNYTSITNRGFQFWVKPAAAGQGHDQSVVLDTNQHGVRISANNHWSLRYRGLDVDSGQNVAFDSWHHVMVVRPYSALTGAQMYVDGNLVAAAAGDYTGGDQTYLTLGASTGDLADGVAGNDPGSSEFFAGTIDDLNMFVLGLGPSTQYGSFSLAADNSYIANRLSGKPLGDVNLDGVVNQSDINAFEAHWLNAKTVGGVVASDLATRMNGDFNFDGVVNIFDAVVLNKGLLAAGFASGLDFSSLGAAHVPEPASIVGCGIAAFVWVGMRCSRHFFTGAMSASPA